MEENQYERKEPDATQNAGCFQCEKTSCDCGNNDDYINKLVSCITKEVMDRLGN